MAKWVSDELPCLGNLFYDFELIKENELNLKRTYFQPVSRIVNEYLWL